MDKHHATKLGSDFGFCGSHTMTESARRVRGSAARPVFGLLCRLVALASACMALSCGSSEKDDSGSAVELGALLPYTGKSAGLGDNIEKSLLWFQESINASGGLLGRKLAIDAHDTHSDPERGLSETQRL